MSSGNSYENAIGEYLVLASVSTLAEFFLLNFFGREGEFASA
jgi:hypothetical protein